MSPEAESLLRFLELWGVISYSSRPGRATGGPFAFCSLSWQRHRQSEPKPQNLESPEEGLISSKTLNSNAFKR